METISDILYNYIPLIQLLIGNGYLVFIQKKVDGSLTSDYASLTQSFSHFFKIYQGALIEHKNLKDTLKDIKDWLSNIADSITALSYISMVYSIILLFFAIEKPAKAELGVFIGAIIGLLYTTLILIFLGKNNARWLRSGWTVLGISIALVIFMSSLINSTYDITHIIPVNFIKLITLFTCFFEVSVIWLGIYIRNKVLSDRSIKLNQLCESVEDINKIREDVLQVSGNINKDNIMKIINTIPDNLKNNIVCDFISGKQQTRNDIITVIEEITANIYSSVQTETTRSSWWWRSN